MSEITPNTPNPVREDTLMKKIMDALGGDYAGIQTPVWRNEEELAVIAKALAAVGAVGSLVLHPTLDDLDMVLDKTWQEIWDAFVAGTSISIVMPESVGTYAEAVTSVGIDTTGDDPVYNVYTGSITFSADAADENPVAAGS